MKTLAKPAPHKIVSRDQWLAARKSLLAKEREHTHQRDELTRQRMALPWVKVDKSYVFDTPAGKQSLADLFEGRSQLIVYHFMFGPTWEEGCPSCSYLMDHIDGALPHLNQRDVTFTAISRAPLAKLEAFKRRMGWRFNWASSSGSDFNYDFDVSYSPEQIAAGDLCYNFEKLPGAPPVDELHGLSVFAKDDVGDVFHTYSAYARGCDALVGAYQYLDLVPKGRDEDGLAFTMAWVRHHDRYETGGPVDPLATYQPPQGGGCCHGEGAKS